MPNYLADTSLIIDLINGRNDRRNYVRSLLQHGDTLGYCAISLIEVYTGLLPGEERITEEYFSRLLYYDITPEIARAAGKLRFEWRMKGQTLSLADAAIAAVTLHHHLQLITDNKKHFPMLPV
jgi:predicted nucleic acid-binding protein